MSEVNVAQNDMAFKNTSNYFESVSCINEHLVAGLSENNYIYFTTIYSILLRNITVQFIALCHLCCDTNLRQLSGSCTQSVLQR